MDNSPCAFAGFFYLNENLLLGQNSGVRIVSAFNLPSVINAQPNSCHPFEGICGKFVVL